ncbi:Recombinase [Mycobacterium marinum]|uniref:recombinase family protein n=1 Tax=Mycobacterium marinum TaxID=1781 RepID=UPI000ECD329A|nr:recombinase family protein [Mycobacterium marinum]RFZ13754.1 Recombinase [Mycobacterium marinum]
MKAYEAGRFDALVAYDLDRLTRQPRQLEDWVDAAEDKGLALVTANGEADLTTDAGRLFARIKMAVARSEVERKSARQKAAALQRAQLGRPPLGVRLTGYTPKGETVPDEADMVRRVFKLFHGGESLKSTARILTEGGVMARNGKPWNPSSVRDILTNPRYAGRAVYDGQVLQGVRGNWEALVTDEVFDVVQARLSDPRRRTQQGTDRKHLGSGLYLCDECGARVTGFAGSQYRCKATHVNRVRAGVDQYVMDVLTERPSRGDAAQLLAGPDEALAPLTERTRALRDQIAAADADYDAGYIDGVRYHARTERVRAELEAVERDMRGYQTGTALDEVLSAPDPVAAFVGGSLMAKRTVIETLCEVRLRRGRHGSKAFDPDTVQITWRR